jgi:small subunit ribosomal protein S17
MAKQMRKVRVGAVVRTTMDKTAVVETVWRQRHPIYHKQMRRVARFYVHDPQRLCRVGDTVRIQETRPISKTKHWRLLEILQRRQVADVQPIELEGDVEPVMTGEALLEAPETTESDETQDRAAEAEEDAK